MIKLGFVLLIAVILVQGMLFWKYQRQVKDICRQLSFLMKHDSNMLITREMDLGGIGELADVLNEWLELKRREKKEYLKKEEMISDTYTNLSHDIRTPLTSLDGYSQLMETCEDQEEQRRYMKIIQERIGSLKEMLEELFTFTKLKNDSFHLEMSSCCINKILKDTIFSYYDEWTGRGIEPEIQITDKLLFMNGNEQGIQRIFQNIIKNGLDHGEKKISISLEEVENNIPTETEQDFIIKEDISPIIEEPTDEDADNEVNNETNNEIAEEGNNDVSDVEEETPSTTDHLDTAQQEVDANKSDEAETEIEVKAELPVEPKTETKAEAEVETKLASTLPPISLDAIVFGTENDEHMGFMHDDDIYFDSDTNVQTEEAEQDLNASETFNAQKTADNSAQTKKKQKRRHRPAQTAPQNGKESKGKESKGNNGKAKKQGEQTPQSNAKPAKNNAKAAKAHAPKAQAQPNAPKEDGNAPQADAKQRANYKRNNRRRRPNKGKQNNNPEAPVA